MRILLVVVLIGCASGVNDPRGVGGLDARPSAGLDAGGATDAGGGGGVDAGGVDASVTGADASSSAAERDICEPCEADGQCGVVARCGDLTAGGRACLPTCVPDIPSCPRAFTCTGVVVGGQNLCLPVGGPCCVDEDGDGYGAGVGCLGADCDDDDPTRHPGREEACNDRDDDCDGEIDEGCDDDGDGYCDASREYAGSARCPNGPGDCDDDDPTIHPGAADPCDMVDRDCSGADGPPGASCGVCGDGFIDAAYGEECDDGNTLSGDGCRGDCRAVECDGGNTSGGARHLIRDGRCYWFDSNVVARSSAAARCALSRGRLLQWRGDTATRDAVWNAVHPRCGACRVWVGIQRAPGGGSTDPSPGNWVWDDVGAALPGDLPWRPGEPSGDGACVEWGGSGGNIFNDIACSGTRDFVCERPRPGTAR
ncbi:MAG: hypothetical protein KF901_29120 [Myxococcales bacterium]|nr:hypothetical protein [Myxococcales bacterium]